jgi:hypothetical protein
LKYAQVPVVAAVQGMALGGGCEFVMHAGKRVMALESYVGLVEAGVGLIPAGGGCKEFAVRAADWAAQSATPGEVFNFLQPVFQTIAMAKVAKSAVEAVEFGFARPTDTILFNANELLWWPSAKPAPWPKPAMPRRHGPRHSGRRQDRYRQFRDDAGQHEGGRHDFRPRLPGRPGGGHRPVRWRSRPAVWSMKNG